MCVRPELVTLPLALAVACACSGEASEAAELREAVEPHLAELAEYDRWARRVALGDSAFRSEEALEEAAFAPLRGHTTVAAAWLERRGPDAHELAHPASAPPPPADGWIRLRTRELGELEAQRARLRIGQREQVWLLVRRSAPAPRNATLLVTLAFAPEP